jgi:dihydrofolate reductase
MGENGLLLHQWIFDDSTEPDKKILADLVETSGAVILGSTTYNTAIEDAWQGKTPFIVPAFVLINRDPVIEKEGFTFVKDGINSAFNQARAVAKEKNIWILGGANVAQQFLFANLLDEIHIHIAPLLLGRGTLLFSREGNKNIRLKRINTIETKGATHIFYEVIK